MTFLRSLLLLLALSIAAPVTAWAQPPPNDQSGDDDGERQAFMKRVRLMRMYALTEALELDEATASRLFPYLRTGDDAMERLHREMQSHRKALRAMAKEESPAERDIDTHIEALGALEKQAAATRTEQIGGLKGILTAQQRLTFVLASGKIERELRRALRERRGEQRRRGDREDKLEQEDHEGERGPPR